MQVQPIGGLHGAAQPFATRDARVDLPVDEGTASTSSFRAFLNQLPIMVWQHGVTGTVTFANSAWYRTLHLPHDASSLTAAGWAAVVHPDDLQRMLSILEGGIQTRSSFELEYRLKPADSAEEYRWYIARAMPQFGSEGRFEGWISSIIDLTERRREKALLSEEQLLLEVIAKGRPLAECMEALTTAASRLSPTVRAAIVDASGERIAGPHVDGVDNHATAIVGSDGKTLGSFVLLFDEPGPADAWEQKIAQFGAHVASIAIERDRTMRELHQSREQLELELSDSKLLQSLSAAMIHEEDVDALYEKIVDAALQIMGSDAASMQMLVPGPSGMPALRLLASRSFGPEAVEYWKWVDVDAGSTCAQSLRTRTRTVAANIPDCDFTLRRNDRALFQEAGIYAAQSTPLFSRKGELLGMITTHWTRPHHPSEHDFRLFDILARQAADLIERRLAEKALRESAERFRAFVATSSDAVYRMSPDWKEMYRLDGREFIADTEAPERDWIDKYIHPDDQPRVWARINEAIASRSTFEMEHRVIRVDGTLGWTHSRAIPLFDENGEIAEWFGAASDITLKKHTEAQQKQALRESQRMVETLQTAFLPQKLPQIERLRFDAEYLAAGEGALVGGDWYDACELPDGRILLCVGDVTGHGLSAAVTAGKLRQAAMVSALTASDPAEILNVLNRVLRFQNPDIYATAILAFVDPGHTRMSYATAGHPPAFLGGGDGVLVTLHAGGLPLGVADDIGARTRSIALPDDFAIAFYSDGLTEFARDINAAEDAIKRATLALAQQPPAERPARAVLEHVLGGTSPSDDVVLLLMQRSTLARGVPCAREDVAPKKTWLFDSNDEAAARTVREALANLSGTMNLDPDSSFAAQIIFGEAIANAVQHAPGPIEVTIERKEDNLVMKVVDQGPGLRSAGNRLPSHVLDESGRGLFLMHALAEDIAITAGAEGGTELRAVIARR